MIPISLRVLALAVSAAYLLAIVAALRSSRMSVKQSMLWLASGVFFLAVSVCPAPLLYAAEWVGFVAPSNAAFVTWLLVLTTLIFYQSLTTSRQAGQIRVLCQEIALLRDGQDPQPSRAPARDDQTHHIASGRPPV